MEPQHPNRGDLVRFPHDPDPMALWDVLAREGDHLRVRKHRQSRTNQRRRLVSLAMLVSVVAGAVA